DPALKEQFKKEKPELVLKQSQGSDTDLIRKIYQELVETADYKSYIAAAARDKLNEKKIIEFILNDMMLANEFFLAHIEENFSKWNDDGEMLVQLLVGYIAKPGSYNFNQLLTPDKAEFAKTLLQTVLEKTTYLQDLIIPKLKNWDPERIALLDMILMKMGV